MYIEVDFSLSIFVLINLVVIVGEKKAARLRWLEYVEKMGEEPAAHLVHLRWSNGRRPIERSRYRWSAVLKDLEDLSTGDCQEQAQNRGAWQNLISEAKIHFEWLRYQSKWFDSHRVKSSVHFTDDEKDKCDEYKLSLFVVSTFALNDAIE